MQKKTRSNIINTSLIEEQCLTQGNVHNYSQVSLNIYNLYQMSKQKTFGHESYPGS